MSDYYVVTATDGKKNFYLVNSLLFKSHDSEDVVNRRTIKLLTEFRNKVGGVVPKKGDRNKAPMLSENKHEAMLFSLEDATNEANAIMKRLSEDKADDINVKVDSKGKR